MWRTFLEVTGEAEVNCSKQAISPTTEEISIVGVNAIFRQLDNKSVSKQEFEGNDNDEDRTNNDQHR
jgi:hypothetical protein